MVGCERSLIISNTQESWLENFETQPKQESATDFFGEIFRILDNYYVEQ